MCWCNGENCHLTAATSWFGLSLQFASCLRGFSPATFGLLVRLVIWTVVLKVIHLPRLPCDELLTWVYPASTQWCWESFQLPATLNWISGWKKEWDIYVCEWKQSIRSRFLSIVMLSARRPLMIIQPLVLERKAAITSYLSSAASPQPTVQCFKNPTSDQPEIPPAQPAALYQLNISPRHCWGFSRRSTTILSQLFRLAFSWTRPLLSQVRNVTVWMLMRCKIEQSHGNKWPGCSRREWVFDSEHVDHRR